MKKRNCILGFLCLLLCCLLLTGCSEKMKSDTLDAQLEQVLDALNRGDEEAFLTLFYPGADSQLDLHQFYAQFRDVWIPTEQNQTELVRYNVNSSSKQTYFQGIYRLPRSDEYSHLEIDYLETEEGRGLTGLKMGSFSEQSSGTAGTRQKIYNALYLVLLLLTVVDIIRKKPTKYGWWIVLTFIFFRIRINRFALAIPVGAIVYWCLRKRLLKEKAEKLKPPVCEPPSEAAPPEPEPKEESETEQESEM